MSNTNSPGQNSGVSVLHTIKQDRGPIALMLLGAVVVYFGMSLASRPDLQTRAYNAGVREYKKQVKLQSGNMVKAAKAFDASLLIYHAGKKGPWLERFTYPYPSPELASRAHFQRAKTMLLSQQAERAVDDFQDSLRLNPGNIYKGLIWEDITRLKDNAYVTKYDLEMLYKARPDLAQAQGKGKGKRPGQNDEAQTERDPSKQAGSGNRDDI